MFDPASMAMSFGLGVLGNALDGGSGQGPSVTTQQTAANPFTSNSGLFGANFQQGAGLPDLTPAELRQVEHLTARSQEMTGGRPVAPQYHDRTGELIPGTGVAAGTNNAARGFTPADLAGLSPQMLNALGQGEGPGGRGAMGMGLEVTDPRMQGIQDSALSGAGGLFDQAGANVNGGMAGQLGGDFLGQMGSMDGNAAQAGNLGSQFMGQLGNLDPMQIAQAQFDQMNPILQEQHQQQALNMENRLFAQGQMGSGGFSPGRQSMEAMFDSQNRDRRNLLHESFGQGMAAQGQVGNMANMFSQLDPNLRGQLGNMGAQMSQLQPGLANQFAQAGNNLFQVPMGIQTGQLNQAEVAGGLSGASRSGSTTNPSMSNTDAFATGLMNSGVNGLNNQINGLFQGGPDFTNTNQNTFAGGY